MNRLSRALAAGAALLGLTGALPACGPSMKDLPLPGTGVSGDTMTLRMEFDDALNLAQGATVKVNGVTEGKVESITAKDFHALASAKVRTDAELRQGATARLRYTTPLGELFVDITNPATGAPLRDGSELGTAQTSTAPTVEDALSEASLLINGGGLGQLQTVTSELNAALGGNEGTIRDLLQQLNGFLIQANQTTGDIDTALNALSSVGQTLDQRRATIDRALSDIKPAADVLRQQTPDFTALLKSLQAFAAQANKTVGATKTQLLATIEEAEGVLAEMAANKSTWADSLDKLAALGAAVDNVIPGDYLNVNVRLNTDLSTLIGSSTGSGGSGGGGGGGSTPPPTGPTPIIPLPSIPALPLPSTGVCILVVCL